MDLGLRGRAAFVAASSKGLGKSVALELAQEGANVIINGRFKESLERTKQEIEKQTNFPNINQLLDKYREKSSTLKETIQQKEELITNLRTKLSELNKKQKQSRQSKLARS